ncbi:hypothetical protein UPYG_G00199940 [Umbra pygmaea]|uniref:Ribosomal RNA-processing protein 8 n=1 Tax=Umbra pygmaea TaxID=75934 RepID=A0ABD0X051_UMBPY
MFCAYAFNVIQCGRQSSDSMFAEEEWNEDPEATALTKMFINSSKVSKSANVTGAVKKKSLLKTLQTLGTVPQWSKTSPLEGGTDSETETVLTPHTKRKKKRSKTRHKVAPSKEEAGQDSGDVDVKEESPWPGVKNPIQYKKPLNAEFKKVKNTESIQDSSKPDSKCIKELMYQGNSAVVSKTEGLSRKQWRNKIKNKKKCKNKFKVQSKESSLPPKKTNAKTVVQKHNEYEQRAASGVNSGKVFPQTQAPPNKKNQQQQMGDRKAQKRKMDPEGKEMTFIKTASAPGIKTVQNNKKCSKTTEVNKEEARRQLVVGEEQQLEPTGSKRRRSDDSRRQEHRKEKLRRILDSQHPVTTEEPTEVDTASLEEPPEDRSAALRSRMELRLESARFRYINQILYTTSSGEAKRMFTQDPQAFGIYHKGFTEQVKHWPDNPVDAIISYIRNKPASLVIADFGCGDCKIALSVKNTVHSFDLAPINKHVTVCDMANVPLKNGTVDIAVFCLSLMGTNLKDFLVEANRVLVMGGILKIAEVASRFESVGNFVSALSGLGFKLVTKNIENSHFYSFEFKKIANLPEKVKARGLELRPCLYKKR